MLEHLKDWHLYKGDDPFRKGLELRRVIVLEDGEPTYEDQWRVPPYKFDFVVED